MVKDDTIGHLTKSAKLALPSRKQKKQEKRGVFLSPFPLAGARGGSQRHLCRESGARRGSVCFMFRLVLFVAFVCLCFVLSPPLFVFLLFLSVNRGPPTSSASKGLKSGPPSSSRVERRWSTGRRSFLLPSLFFSSFFYPLPLRPPPPLPPRVPRTAGVSFFLLLLLFYRLTCKRTCWPLKVDPSLRRASCPHIVNCERGGKK